MMITRTALRCALILFAAASVTTAAETKTITNPLKLSFPWDAVSLDYPAGTFTGEVKAQVGDAERPAQVESVVVSDKTIDRIWFMATIGNKDESVEVKLDKGHVDSPLKVTNSEQYVVIENGISTLRITDYSKVDVAGKKLSEIPHWLGGFKIGNSDMDGRAWFEGSSVLKSAKTTVLAKGPVFADILVSYEFEANQSDGTVEAQPMQLGKQTFRYAPGELPREAIAKDTHRYELMIRVVMNDPWIEIVERYRLPRDESVENFKTHQYQLHFGAKPDNYPAGNVPAGQSLKLDTAMWTRWFEWDSFGGNNSLNFTDARPRPAQKGRPFVILRARWNQGGGGGQDFFLTSGGKDGAGDLPAVGVVAAYPSKWVGPYAATMFANAYDGNRGQIRVPLIDGDGGDSDSTQDPKWYGERAYALCIGPRELFDNSNKIDSLVRRHTDWTLNAQVNKYILEWKRDPSVAGANIITSRKRIEQIRDDLKNARDTFAVRTLNDVKKSRAEMQAELDKLDSKSDEAKALKKKIDGLVSGNLLAMLEGRKTNRPSMPSPDQYLGRRYQADDVNPTNYGTRRMINGPFPDSDLYSIDQPYGDAQTAAIGYICTDLDAWPGYRNGWGPGNPNFHTDKYIGALFAAAAMRDHPHAKEWFAFGQEQFNDDVKRVVTAPDGAGYECPGYAGYSVGLQTDLARVFFNAGVSNPIADNPLFKKTTVWHRKLLTPVDPRLGFRHEAPHGDTHRWTSGIGAEGFAKLALFYRDADPKHASELMGTFRMLAGDKWKPKSLQTAIFEMDLDIPATPAAQMDWSSDYFHGFGPIFRSAFGTDRESFLSMKAGWTGGHYHNDELAFHFYNHNTPISLDYNCSYHPRGDHAALHNSMTFGKEGQVRHNQRNTNVDAIEQIYGSARVGAFVATPVADVVVAERSAGSVGMAPVDPEDAEFSRQYGSRKVSPIVHRRLLAMVKQDAKSPLSDYLVVRDETQSDEPQQINLHLLARSAEIGKDSVKLVGQWDQDMLVSVVESTDLKIDQRYWAYFDEWMGYPAAIAAKAGESDADWGKRVEGQTENFKPDFLKREALGGNQKSWHDAIESTKGRAMMPPPGWNMPWTYGEAQIWLRMSTKPGTATTWVLYPYQRGTPAPTITRRDDGSVEVKMGDAVDVISINSEKGVELTRNGNKTELIKSGELPALGKIPAEIPAILRK